MRKILITSLLLCLFSFGIQAQWKRQPSFKGQRFPEFTVKEWISKQPKLKGKFILVDFWCIEAYPVTHRTIPYQNQLAKKYKKQLQVIGLTHDEANIVKLMVEPYIQYYSGIVDWDTINDIFKLEGWPTSYLIDPEGTVVWEGYVLKEGQGEKNVFNLTEEKLEQFFKDYQQKKKSRKSKKS